MRFILCLLLPASLALKAEKPILETVPARVASGGLIRITGKHLAAEPHAVEKPPWPTALGGTSVHLRCGRTEEGAAALRSASKEVIEGQLPYFAEGLCRLKVVVAGKESDAAEIEIVARDPRVKTEAGGLAVFYRRFEDSSALEAAWARPGRRIYLAMTGLGAVSPTREAGELGDVEKRSVPAVVPSLRLGGIELEVTGTWLSATAVGQYIVEFVAPGGIVPGNSLVELGTEYKDQQGKVQINWEPAAYLPVGAAVEEIAAATIGPEGGAIGDGDFTFQVPAKALTTPVTLRLSRPVSPEEARGARLAGEPGETRLKYVLEGVPKDLTVGPGLSLNAYPAELDNGGTFIIRMGPNNEVHFEPVKSASNGLVLSDEDFIRPGASDTEIEFAIRSHSARCASLGGRFVIYALQGCAGTPEEILRAAEAAYQALGPDQGLDWSRRKRWPIRMTLEDFGADNQRWGEHVPNSDRNMDYVRFNSRMIEAARAGGQDWQRSLWATVGHELFHLMQHLYDPRSDSMAAKFPGDWFWMMEALSTWAEGVAVGDPNYIAPSVRQQDWGFLFRNGLEYRPPLSCSFTPLHFFWPDECAKVQNHGYGASLLLRYLMANGAPADLPGALIRRMAEGDGPVEALEKVAKVGSRWEDFVRHLIETGFTPERVPSIPDLLSLGSVTFAPKHGEGESGRRLVDTIAIPDLSVRFYRIRLYERLKSPRTPFFVKQKQEIPLMVLVHRLEPNSVKLLARGSSRNVVVNDATALAQENAVLLVAVINSRVREPYTGSWLAELEVGVGATIMEVVGRMSKLSCTVSADISVTQEPEGGAKSSETWKNGFTFTLSGISFGTTFKGSGTNNLTGSGLALDFDARDRVPVLVEAEGALEGEESPVVSMVKAHYTRRAELSTLITTDDVTLTIANLPLHFSGGSSYYWEDSSFVDFRDTFPFRRASAQVSGTTRRLMLTGTPPAEKPTMTIKYNQFSFSSGNIASCRFSR